MKLVTKCATFIQSPDSVTALDSVQFLTVFSLPIRLSITPNWITTLQPWSNWITSLSSHEIVHEDGNNEVQNYARA
jgi:hypothetical protein